MQIEIDRRCYLTPTGEPGERFDEVAAFLDSLAAVLGAELLDRRLAAAAE
jgi:hypothetical protein